MTKKRKLFKVLTAITTATLLEACAGQAPAPCVNPEVPDAVQGPQQAAQSTTQVPGAIQIPQQSAADLPQQAAEDLPQQSAKDLPQQAEVQDDGAVQDIGAESPQPRPATQDAGTVQALPQPAVQDRQQPTEPVQPEPVDPYLALPNMVSSIFDHAKNLFTQDNVDAAVSYLQRFRILKPLWNEWESRADSLLNVFGQSNAERAKQYESLILELKNMNRVQAAYSLVAEAADSLMALAPGDSLVQFAKEQKNIAYKNTLGKALKEKVQILALAESYARFDEALKQATAFQMRYRDFENELMIGKMIEYIQKLQNSVNEEDKKFWEKNDPEKALAEVDTLIAKKAFTKAKNLVEKLKASNLRRQAAEKYQKLADAVCTEKRKYASQQYIKATKQKNVDKKKQILMDAIGALSACSDDYPEYDKIKTVTDNITFLKAELDR